MHADHRYPEGRKRSDHSESCSSDTNKCEHAIITQVNGEATITSDQPVLAGKSVGGIILPLEWSSIISFKDDATLEPEPRRGSGELMRRLKTALRGLDYRNEGLRAITWPEEQVLLFCSASRIVTERRICNADGFTWTGPPESDSMSWLEELTDAGHRALRRYDRNRDQADLRDAVACFERAQDICTLDHPNRSNMLFNFAIAKFVRCRDNSDYQCLDVAIRLLQGALQLNTSHHREHCMTALELCFTLLAHVQLQGQEKDGTGAKKSLPNVVRSYSYRAAWLGLQMAEISVSIKTTESAISPVQRAGPSNHEQAQRTRIISLDLPDGITDLPAALASIGTSLCRQFESNGELVHLQEAIVVLEHAVQLTPYGHPNKPGRMNDLGNSLLHRFQCFGNPADIDKSISIFEVAVDLTHDSHPDKPGWLNSLGSALFRRFERFGDLADMAKSISASEEALRLTPDDHPYKPVWLNSLGNALSSRFERFGGLTDINKSISIREEAIRLTPNSHPNRPARLNNLGDSLFRRFGRVGDLADIAKCISMFEEALHLTPDRHPAKSTWLGNLASSYLVRFGRLGDLTDIDKSVSMLEEAVRLTPNGHPDKPTWLTNLSSSFSRRFQCLGDLADINKSIAISEEAVRLTPDRHPDKPGRLTNLGSSFFRRFERLGDPADADKSISMFWDAVHLTPDDHPNKSGWLNNLGSSFFRRFERLGDIADIDGSISMFEQAIRLTPDGHPSKPGRLNNLGSSLFRRFERLDDLADSNKSISMFEEAVHLAPDGHPDKPGWLGNLAASLLSRFMRLGGILDLDKSISMLEKAIHLTPNNHPTKPAWLGNLGSSLSTRSERFHDFEDTEKSIWMYSEAVRLSPNGHPHKPTWLSNLGSSLLSRFKRRRDLTDLHKSISVSEEAVRLIPKDHPDKAVRLKNLGNSFMMRFAHFRNPSDLSAATLHFSLASRASAGSTSIRFHAVRQWISCTHLQGDPSALLDAYTTAIGLLPQLAWLGLPLPERHRVLVEAADIARDAAAAAVDAGYPEMAAEWLEQGRSIVWNQFLELRTPVDDLRVKHPAIAEQFQQVSQELERASSRYHYTFRQLNDLFNEAQSVEEMVQRHHELALKREKLLLEIRSLPGLNRFLLSKTIEQLATSAASGPIVYLNASRQRCDALIVMAELGAVAVPLPGVSHSELKDLQRVLRLSLARNRLIISRDDISALIPSDENSVSHQFFDSLLEGDSADAIDRAARVRPQRIEGYTPDELFRRILGYVWNQVVNPVLQALGFSIPQSGSQEMVHIFWCPTGPFAFLPIHAAGLYGTTGAGAKLFDFAISSYIPTLSALAPPAQRELNDPLSFLRLVAIPQPLEDGQSRLPCIEEEIDCIKTLSAESRFVALQGSDGTVEDVMKKMADADWVHFACHGVQDPDNPLDSGLCLAHSRRLKLSDIIRLSRPQGGLAFLSACQTAQGDETLSEESVHLAAGMLLAGYGGVIATMWSIMDRDAPRVAKDVYGHLFRDGKVPDSTEAAEALHYAVQHLRDSGAPFTSWVPFIHVGR